MYNREKIMKVMHEIVDGSKSIAPYVVIAQPRRIKGETPAQKLDGYEGLHIDLLGISHGFCEVYGEKVDVARNYLIEQVLESGAKYLFFVGEDTVIPYDGFKKLHETAEANPGAIVTGVYYIKLSNAMIMVKNENWISIPNVDPGQIIEAWQTGMDAMLIPVDILRKMKEEDPELPFCCIANNIEGIPFIGEDNFFVHRIHRLGIKLLVDTDVQCLHMDLASGKYTAHPGVDLNNYYTNIKITEPLTLEDKKYIDHRWISRVPGEQKKTVRGWIDQLKEQGKPVKFNMGSGRDKLDGYIAVDKHNTVADINEDLLELELPENSTDEIFGSHVIEHVYHMRAPQLLTTWYKGLKPGGKLILETPNLEGLCRDFLNADEQQRYILTHCIYGAFADHIDQDKIESGSASFHVWGYYPAAISNILREVGFSKIDVLPQQGQHPGNNFRIEAIK